MTSIAAIVCARNEAVHMRRCLRNLVESGCEVWLIDNESDDGTREIAETFAGGGLLGISHLPWRGAFSLSDQLREKKRVIDGLRHDWVVHVDADEWLVSPVPGETLGQAIARADRDRADNVNFHELVFAPQPGEDFYRVDYAALMRTYYFFQPHYPRLNRAWRRAAALDNFASGGHVLEGPAKRWDTDLFLRHYIVLSHDHARSKYVRRRFAAEDLDRGWHCNRAIITEDQLWLRPNSALRQLDDPQRHFFDLSEPVLTHFWQWHADAR